MVIGGTTTIPKLNLGDMTHIQETFWYEKSYIFNVLGLCGPERLYRSPNKLINYLIFYYKDFFWLWLSISIGVYIAYKLLKNYNGDDNVDRIHRTLFVC